MKHKMTDAEYNSYVLSISPKSDLKRDCLHAFLIGGLICMVGQLLLNFFGGTLGMERESAAAAASITLVFCSALLTGLSLYDDLARFAGAGTLVPITGFANAMVSPAIEFKTEGFVTGLAVKMFSIAGPVLVYGISASVVYGIIYWVISVL